MYIYIVRDIVCVCVSVYIQFTTFCGILSIQQFLYDPADQITNQVKAKPLGQRERYLEVCSVINKLELNSIMIKMKCGFTQNQLSRATLV